MAPSSVHSGPKTKTVTGPVEAANRGGVKIADAWHNYGRTFRGERLGKDAVGKRMVLILVWSTQDAKWFIRSVTAAAEPKGDVPAKGASSKAPAPARETRETEGGLLASEAEPGSSNGSESSDDECRLATPEALKYAEDLALKEGWTNEELASLVSRRFGKPFSELAPGEASKLIVFFGGYQLSGNRASSPGT
jgi:hypothetical protein